MRLRFFYVQNPIGALGDSLLVYWVRDSWRGETEVLDIHNTTSREMLSVVKYNVRIVYVNG